MLSGPSTRISNGRGRVAVSLRRTAGRCCRATMWLLATSFVALWISDISRFESGGVSAALLRQSAAPPVIPAAARSFAVYATGTTCGAVSMSGGGIVDSFDSSQGTYAETRTQGQARVGVTGNVNLSGSKSIVYGRIFALNTNVGSCKNGVPGITLTGGAVVTEGFVRLPSAPVFPAPANVTPGSQDINAGTNLALAPGTYGRIAISGGATLTLAAGTYNINSLSLSGGSVLATAPSGQVIVNVAGVKVSQPVNMSGGTLHNQSGIPLNFQLIYGGSQSIVLSGGTQAYGVIYAPNAGVKLSGGGGWFGAMTVKTLDDSGGSPLHYDRALIVPPTITSTVTPAPNANGWHKTTVAVSFTCSGPLGIASCPSPVTVTTEGRGQVVSGTVTDVAGNTATTSVTLNIDKTPPVVTATGSPAANGSGWNRTPVSIHFTCADSGSGIATCGPDAVLSTEGTKQTATGTATDLAGNTASVTTGAVNIDLTPPVVAVTSPPNGSVVSVSPATLAGTVSDALSGVSSVACNGQAGTVSGGTFQCAVTLTQGANSISALATDVAGNTNTAPWALTFTPTTGPPALTLTVTEPTNGGIVPQSPITVRGTVSDPTARVVVQNVIASVVGTTFEARNITLSEGRTDVAVRATTIAGQQANSTLTLTLDSIAPALTVFSPPDRSLFTTTSATVSAAASDATPLTCSINGVAAAVQNGLFSSVLTLTSGSNAVAVSCADAAGHISSRSLTLFQDTAPLVISAVEPADGATAVPTSAPVRITFSEAIDPATATSATVVLRAGAAILPLDVAVSVDGLVATATPRVPLPQGTNVVTTVTAGVRDQAGNPLAVPFVAAFTTEGTALAPGVVVGEVYDDSRSRPLPGAIVEALDRTTRQVLAKTLSDERGQYLLDPGRADFLVRVASEGYTTVERPSAEPRGTYAEALDARLTPLAATQTVQAALGGTLTTAAGDAVVLPAGTLASDASVSLTAIGSQGPIAAFPVGWTPLSIVSLEAPQGLPFSATLRLKDRSLAAAGRNAVVAYYDGASASWVALAQVVVPAAGTPLEYTEFIRPGQFALLVPDDGGGGPGATVVGETLPAGSTGEIPSGAQAQGTVTPSVGRPDDPTPAQARVEISGTTTLRSGTLLRGDFMEVVTLRSGGVVSPFDTSQDFVAYRTLTDASGSSLAASFPIAPSKTFPAADVTDGSVTVRLSRGVTTGRTLVGPAGGGVSSGDGSRAVVPAGALSSNVPVSLRRLDSATFPLSVPTNVTFIGGLDLDLSGAVASLPLTLSLSGSGTTVPTGSTVIVTEVRNIKGFDRLVIVALGQVNASDVMTTQANAGETLTGVRQSGRYGFYRVDGTVAPVRGSARTDTGQRAGHVTELAALPFVSVTDSTGAFVLVSLPGSFDLTATAAANGDQARVSGTTGTLLAEIVIGPTPPRVEKVLVRLPPLEGDFAGPVTLVGNPRPLIDDDSSGNSLGNGNGAIESGERIELTLYVRNDGTIPIQGGFFALDLRGPPGAIPVEPARIPLAFLPPDEPQAVGPFVFTVPAGVDPALLRYRLAYANAGGLANVIPFSLPLAVEHPNVAPASEIRIRFSEPVKRDALNGAITLARETTSGLVPVDSSLVVAADNTSLMMRPLAPLADDTVYRITLTSQIVDADGRSLAGAPHVERLRTVDRTPPVVAPGQIEASVPDEEGFVTITGSPGTVNPDDTVIGLNATTGFSALATVNPDGSVRVLVAADATDALSVLVRDANGNTTTLQVGMLVQRDPITGALTLAILGRAGGTVTTADGIRLTVPEGAVQRGTELSVRRLTEPFQLPADLLADPAVVSAFNARFTVVDRVRITTNVTRFTAPIALSLPAPAGAVVGQQFVVWRNRTVTFGGPLADLDRQTGIPLANNPRVTAERLVIVESATVKQQGGQLVLSTDSPPFPGITEGGDYTIARVNPSLVYFAGEVRRDSATGPVVPGVVVRSLPDATVNSAFAAVTGSDGRFLVADASLTTPYQSGATITNRLDVLDRQYSRVIRRDVRGVVGMPAPTATIVAHFEEGFVLPSGLPAEIIAILGDVERPTVTLRITGETFVSGFTAVGSPILVTVEAQDDDQLTFVGLELDEGQGLSPVALSPTNTFQLTPLVAGVLHVRGQARDRSGNVTFQDVWVRALSAGSGGGAGGPCDLSDPSCITATSLRPQLLLWECPGSDGSFEVQFSEPILSSSVTPLTVRILEPNGSHLDYTFRLRNHNSRLIVTPKRYLTLGVRYRLELTDDLADTETPPLHFVGTSVECDVASPTFLTVIGKPAPNSTTQSAAVQAINGETVADVATLGDTVVVATYPSSSNVGDVGHLHAFHLRFQNNLFDTVETLASAVPVLGHPKTLATVGTRVYVGNRYLGPIATKRPFIAALLGSNFSSPDLLTALETGEIPADLYAYLGCMPTPPFLSLLDFVDFAVTGFALGEFRSPWDICTGLFQFWHDRPQPPSNLEVFDFQDIRLPRFLGASPLNVVSSEVWDPNTFPSRIESTPQGLAVHNFLNNIEIFSADLRPLGPTGATLPSLGIIGQVLRYGEVTPRGPDGVYRTADDLENEFLDAAFFDGFLAAQVREGIRLMDTTPLHRGENSSQLAFLPLPGAQGGRLGAVPRFEWGGDQGTDNLSDLAFITTTDRVLQIFNVTDPVAPVPLGRLPNTFGNMSFDACRGIAYVHGPLGELHVVDFNDPLHPVELNRPDDPTLAFTVQGPSGRALLGRPITLNGNTNRDGVVYLGTDEGVTVVQISVAANYRFMSRDSCQLRLTPSSAVVPSAGTQGFVASGGGRGYVFTINADTTGGASVTDNGNGTARYTAGPTPGESTVRVTVSDSNGLYADGHVDVPSVEITSPHLGVIGRRIATPIRQAVVGQRVDLRGHVITAPHVSVTSEKWVINGDNAIKRYEMSSHEGTVIPLNSNDLTGSSLAFYWSKPGVEVVRYEVIINGQPHWAETVFEVRSPTVSTDFNTGCAPDGTPDHRPCLTRIIPDVFVRAGDPAEPLLQSGIKIATAVDNQTGVDGVLAFTQLIEFILSDVQDRVLSTTVAAYFDTSVNADKPTLDKCDIQAWNSVQHVDANGQTLSGFLDYPQTELWVTPYNDAITVRRRDQFSLYQMFKPSSSEYCAGSDCAIWVTLEKLNWSWDGDALRPLWLSFSDRAWSMSYRDGPNVTSSVSKDLPQWKGWWPPPPRLQCNP